MRLDQRFQLAISATTVLSAVGIACAQGQVVGWGDNQFEVLSQSVTSLLAPVRLAGARESSFVLQRDGTVLSWGGNGDGQRNLPSDASSLTCIDMGDAHGLAILANGSVIGWGRNDDSQATVPAGIVDAVQVAAGNTHSLVLRSDGSIVAWGGNTFGQANVPAGLSARWIAAGGNHCLAVLADGTVRGWGYNFSNVATVPPGMSGIAKAAAGQSHSVLLRGDGTVVVWGSNFQGQRNVPAGLADVRQIDCGAYHTLALRSNGTVAAWGAGSAPTGGSPNFGQSVVPQGLNDVVEIAAGSTHSLALRRDGSIVAWGNNSSGQANAPVARTSIVSVSSGGYHVLALRADGTVQSWGQVEQKQSIVPAGLADVRQVAAGGYHSLALKTDGTVVGWGEDSYGQATVPTALTGVSHIAAGSNHSLALRSEGTLAAWGLNNFGQTSIPIGATGIARIAAGVYHNAALRGDGSLLCWGSNEQGQTNVPAGLGGVLEVAAGYQHSIVCRTDGSVVAWGGNDFGQTTVPGDLAGVMQVSAGYYHSVALRSNGTVAAWGRQIGTSMPAGLDGVSQISAGFAFTSALLNSERSGCGNPSAPGLATLAGSGSPWQQLGTWSWSSGVAPQIPGSLASVDFGNFGSVGSECAAEAGTLTARSGTSLLVPASASVSGNDYSIRVGGTANLAGRLWLLGVTGAGGTLPENLNISVLSAGTVNGNFDLIQSELPPPSGFFLTLVPEDVNGRTVFSLRLLPLPGGGELTASSTGTFSGKAVAAETIDINHDGFDDLALAVDFGAAQPGLIQILLNDGSGGLGSTSVLTSIPPQPTCLAVGDVDGDGDRDVAVGISSDSTARVYLDNGAGSLAAGTVYSGLGGTPLSIAIVEPSSASLMAASGFVAVGTSTSKLRIYRDSSLQQEIALAGAPGALRPGKTDVIRPTGINTGGTRTASFDGLLPVAETGFMQTLTLAPSGLFEIRQTFFLTAKPVAMDVADLDGDGLDDIVTANSDPVLPATGSALPVLSIFRNSGGTFGGGVPFQPTNASSGLDVTLIDVDNDGDRDIVSVYKRAGSDSEAALLRVDTLGPGTPISIGQTTVLDASDPILSARGNLDGSGGEDLFLVNQPSGSFLAGAQEVKPFLATGGLKQGDLDGDGTVGASDIALLLLDFGPCPGCPSDLDGSGEVDGGDLSFLLLLFE